MGIPLERSPRPAFRPGTLSPNRRGRSDRGGAPPAPSAEPPAGAHPLWSAARWAVWGAGGALLGLLWNGSSLGTTLLWNVLVPLAPAILVWAPGVWRNLCPLATTARLARSLPGSAGRPLSAAAQGRLLLAGTLALGIVVPARHLGLNWKGEWSAALLTAAAAAAAAMGFTFRGKSGWCNSLCPVHPVERLYGSRPALQVPNTQCAACLLCSSPCPEATPGAPRLLRTPGSPGRWAETLMIGGFPGFVSGWFLVPDFSGGVDLASVVRAYLFPWGGAAVSLALYEGLRRFLPLRGIPALSRIFGITAVAVYYGFRIPALFGFGRYPSDGLLVDVKGTGGEPFVAVARWVLPGLLVAWAVLPAGRRRGWTARPPRVRPEPTLPPSAADVPARSAIPMRGSEGRVD